MKPGAMKPPEPQDPSAAPGAHVQRAAGHVRRLLSFDVLNRIARFAAAVLLARSLSIDDFGALNVGIAAAGILVTITGLGLGEQAARDVAVRPEAAGELAGKVLGIRLAALGTIAAAGLAVVALVKPDYLDLAALTAVMALGTAISAEWALRGMELMRQLGITLAAGGAVVLVGAGVLALTGGTAAAALAIFAAGEVVASLLAWAFAGSRVRPLRVSVSGARELLRRSWPLGLATLALYGTYANVDTIILGAFRGAEDAGLYTAPYRVFLTLNLVAVFAAYSFLPSISRGAEAGDDSAYVGLRLGLSYMLGYGAIVLGVAELAGEELLGGIFGSDFREMAPTFVALCIGTVWFAVAYPAGYALIGAERNRRFLLGAGTAAVLTLALDFILIPPFGPIGAAAATSGALVVAGLVWLRGHEILDHDFLSSLATMVAVSAMAIAALIEPDLRPFAGAVTVAAGLIWLWVGRRRLGHGDGAAA